MTTASFQIVLFPKPIYVAGSGPPMAPVTLLPEHDEASWVIAQVIDYYKIPHYVVHPKDKPVVRKIIRKIDALDWVSPRVCEAFEMAEARRRDAQEEELKQAKALAKLTKNGKKRGRPFKNPETGTWTSAALVESIETETDTLDEGADSLAPRPPQPSNQQPTLSIPSLSQPHPRHNMDSLFDTEGIPDSMDPPPSKRFHTDMSEGPSSKTPRNPQEPIISSPQTVQKKNLAPTSTQPQQSKSMAEPTTPRHTPSPSKTRTPQRSTAPPSATANSERRELRDRSAQPFYGHQRQLSQTVHSSHSASPAKSSRKSTTPARPARYPTRSSSRSRNATPSGGDVQRTPNKGWKSAPAKSTASTPQKRSRTSTPSKPKPKPVAESDDDDDENKVDGKQWKVIRLLDDKYRMNKHRRCHYYLTQWAGDYAPTWERSVNITNDLKVEYEAWKKSSGGKERRAKKSPSAEKGHKASVAVEKDVDTPRNVDTPRSLESPPLDSSEDDQAQASKQLGNDIGGLFVPEETGDDDDSPDPLVAAEPAVAVKHERLEMEMDLDELPLARSPYFPGEPSAELEEDEEEYTL
ncbi:hypothetical protein V492_03908 [Pseudogymnoascus sp. VKM F-4246]|nr:hypothetical protein V492_03908 [Pseudogymnoascus sp. VKM F-4246]